MTPDELTRLDHRALLVHIDDVLDNGTPNDRRLAELADDLGVNMMIDLTDLGESTKNL